MVGIEHLITTHDEEACAGRHCSIHNPSDHHMRSWPLNWREDRAIMERLCRHGIGHDDPDDLTYRRTVGRESSGIHGCDGCCRPPLEEVNLINTLNKMYDEAKALGDSFPWDQLTGVEEDRIFSVVDKYMELITCLEQFFNMDLNHVSWYGEDFSDGVTYTIDKLEHYLNRLNKE